MILREFDFDLNCDLRVTGTFGRFEGYRRNPELWGDVQSGHQENGKLIILQY